MHPAILLIPTFGMYYGRLEPRHGNRRGCVVPPVRVRQLNQRNVGSQVKPGGITGGMGHG